MTSAYHFVIIRHTSYVTAGGGGHVDRGRRIRFSSTLTPPPGTAMPRGPSIPPYLTAGASSRTHHALLAQLSQADSAQEEDQIIAHHLTQAKAVLQSNDVNTVGFSCRYCEKI